MGKKDKKADAAKVQAKKARQAAKQHKTDVKRTKKELKNAGEIDIEAIIAEFTAKERAKTAVCVSISTQPSRRANFSMTSLPNGEMLMFGGEYCDGESTEVYNDLFRWNVEKNEWKLIESLNTPPPRCSHQTVLYNDKIYMFGGEYATLDQFYHYRDFWELDLKTNTWTELSCSGDVPTARSGHRMVVWRNYLILFGGFYEAMREVRWYNDLYFYSFQERRWVSVAYKTHASVPKPRSGVLMFIHSSEDTLYIFGGYSKQKEGSKQEGKIHEDMWMLPLKPLITGGKTSALDFSKLSWQKITRKGDYPSPRCGAATGIYKNKVLVFGGVCDHEGPRHSMISTFYDDLFAFDMERKRWYKLGLKQLKFKASRNTKEKKNVESVEESEHGSDDDDDNDDDDSCAHNEIGVNEQGELFGYIDEAGNVVYIELDEGEVPAQQMADILPDREKLPVPQEAFDNLQIGDGAENPLSKESSPSTEICMEISEISPQDNLGNTLESLEMSFQPCARINPSIMIRGNTLFLYGGVTEKGDLEVTLDDCWSLDINKRDQWKKVLTGTMSSIVWNGGNDDDTTSQNTGSLMGESEDDDNDDDEDSCDSEEDDNDEDEDEHEHRTKKDKLLQKSASKSGQVSRKTEMEMLRAYFGTTDEFRTPRSGESLREFYSRTAAHWSGEVISGWHSANSQGAPLSEKDIKREGFARAEARYQELLPMLSRLNELEREQQADEDRFSRSYSKTSKTNHKR